MVEKICGTPRALFQQICEVYCNTYQDHLSATQLYAMGWTQHTKGSQIIRTASILQLLLGNVGVAGGGINALRGWHNVQGSTDHGVLFNVLTGYNVCPQNTPQHSTLGRGPLDASDTYLKDQTPLSPGSRSHQFPGERQLVGQSAKVCGQHAESMVAFRSCRYELWLSPEETQRYEPYILI